MEGIIDTFSGCSKESSLPSLEDRDQLGTEEMRELSRQGPFGGIQTEVPQTMIDELGFAAASNICFRLGRAVARPGIAQQSVVGSAGFPTTSRIVGFAKFYPENATVATGSPAQVAFKGPSNGGDGGLYFLQGGNVWTKVAGSNAFNPIIHPVWGVLEGQLCYTDGAGSTVQLWDGTTVTNPAGAPQAQAMAEIALHLLTGNGTLYTWSGVGDPTDWTSFSSGNNNYVTDIGPITGILKLGQAGYGFHVEGIVQIIPTGLGTVPFDFQPLISTNKGSISLGLLTKFEYGGVDCAAYMSEGNVQLFNQTQCLPIGDAPLQGRKRMGARQQIMADFYNARTHITSSTPFNSSGFDGLVTENIVGVPFKALWLLMNNIIWCYNLDEENWTRFNLGTVNNVTADQYTTLGKLTFDAGLEGAGLAGVWPSLALSKQSNVFQMDFNTPCEQSCSLTSGKITFEDVRHSHTVKKFRLRFTDHGTITYTLTVTNEKNQSQTQTATLGTNSGDDLAYIFSFSLPGLRFTYNISTPSGTAFDVIELAPYYDKGGEQRGGVIDN